MLNNHNFNNKEGVSQLGVNSLVCLFLKELSFKTFYKSLTSYQKYNNLG